MEYHDEIIKLTATEEEIKEALDTGKWKYMVIEMDKWLDDRFREHIEACDKCKNWDGLTHGICDYALALKESINKLNATIEKIL